MLHTSLHGRQSPFRLLMTCAALACALPAVAQDERVPSLLFEPVVIDVIESDAPDAPYTVRELTSLPRGDTPVELQSWLAERRTAPVLDTDRLTADIAAYEQAVLARESTGGAFEAGLDEEL
ncbi:MAG: hypothetical protein SV422_14525, partial [Pseudomonadota bacterium]|nr:hypothetical protein [Pseudomonadota bacterium]